MKSENPLNTKNLHMILFVALLALLLAVHWISGTNESSNSKAFNIVEADGNTAIANAHITICRNNKVIYQTSSDESGRFRLPDFGESTFSVRFDATGYVSEELVGQCSGNIQQTIRLFKESIVKGQVVRKKDHRPLPGARLNLWGPRGNAQAISDKNGNFYFSQLPSGNYTLQLQIEGYSVTDPQQFEIHGGESVVKDFEVTVGSLFTGKILDKETNQPLSGIYVYMSGSAFYHDYTDDTGFFSFANIQPGSYRLTIYHEGFKDLRENTIEIREGQSMLNQIYLLEPRDPEFQIYSNQQVFLPGEKFQTRLRSYRIPELNCKLYRISNEELRSSKGLWLRQTEKLLTNHKPISSWIKKIEIKDVTRWQTRTITFPVGRRGFYILEVSAKGRNKFVPFFSTGLALITKTAPDSVLVWSHQLSNSAPISRTEIMVEKEQYKSDGTPISQAIGNTNQDGLLRFENTSGSLRVWGFKGEDAAYVDAYSGNAQSNNLQAYIYTDRPVYRPGQTVYFKGIVRKDNGGTYEILPQFSCPLLIRDSSGTIVFQQQIAANQHGSFSGEFKLADEPALGTYEIQLQTAGSPHGQFKVLEYRKPEFSIDVIPAKSRYFNSETVETKILAKYYFGSPVANQTIEYTVLDAPYYSWNFYYQDDDYENEEYYYDYEYRDYYGYGRVITSGSVQLNENGEANISFPATKENFDRYYNIEAKIVDQSRREVTGRGRTLVTRGEYKLGIFTDSYVYKEGEKIQFRIKTSDYDDKPLSVKAQATGSYEHWDEKNRNYSFVQNWSEEIKTDGSGTASFTFGAAKSGYVRVELAADDSRNNHITATTWIWIAGDGQDVYGWYNRRALDLVPDKKQKQPGELTKILINSSQKNTWALLTYEGAKIHKAEVIHIRGNSKLISFPALAQYAPTLFVTVNFSSQKQFYSRSIPIQIATDWKFLKIQISSDKEQYKPRDEAKYTVKVTDQSNHPVATEFSFSLVDESIYAISPEIAPEIQKFFYGPKQNRVITYYSFPPRYLGGADKDGNKEIRKDFPDTAYWTASGETSADGIAHLEIKLPDSLTTWRATVRAASDQTQVGSAIQKVIATKTLIARLETPRFFTVGDRLIVTGVFHNLSPGNLSVQASLLTDEKLRRKETSDQNVQLKPGDVKRVDWKIDVSKAGTTKLILKADAKTDFDGMQLEIPVYPFGLQRLRNFAGQTNRSTSTTFRVDTDENLDTAHLKLYFTPSVAGMAFQSLEYLTGYPYGCVEQTMSRFLPDLVVEQALKKLQLKNPQLSAELPKQINAGLQRLYHFQHDDGGWGWWENDETDPYMTSYVIYGLLQAQRAGYNVDSQRLANGVNALKVFYEKESSESARAYMLFALSQDNQESQYVLTKVQEFESRLDQLDSYSLAALTLAADQAGNRPIASKILTALKLRVSLSEQYAVWVPKERSYGWCDSRVETTAYAVRVLLQIEPNSDLIPRAVRWLAAQREGDRWQSTKDTAATIITLIDYVQKSNELIGQYTARLYLNGTEVGQMQVTPANVWNFRKDLDLYVPVLKAGDNELRIEMNGAGRLYFSGQVRYFEDGKKVAAETKGIKVDRQYFRYKRTAGQDNYVTDLNEVLKGDVKVGEEILVKLTVEAQDPFEYVIVEDPLPSGFEVVVDPGDYYDWTYWYCGRQIRDEKVAFFSTWLYQGKREIYYIIRGEVPGAVQVSPSQSWAMYLPEIRGNSTGNFLTVKD